MGALVANLTSAGVETWGVAGLVAVAVASVVWTIVRQIQRIGTERGERLDAVDRGANTIYHFISREALLQLRIEVGVLVAGVFVAILVIFHAGGPVVWVLVPPVLGVVASFLPWLYYKKKARDRAALFADQMLDLALGLANGLKAGQALPQALEAVSRNSPDPMREELAVVLREHQLGVELPVALDRMQARLPGEDLQLLCSAIRLTVKSGGSLAEVIQKISNLIRNRIDFHRRLSALTAQGRFEALAMSLAPLAAFILLFLADRELMLPLVTTAFGWAAIGGVAVLETVGYFIIRKIIDIDV